MIRRIIVAVAAIGLRHDVSTEEINRRLTRCFPHRHWLWRMHVIEDAQARNARRSEKSLAR